MAKGYFINPETKEEYFDYDMFYYNSAYTSSYTFKCYLPVTSKEDDDDIWFGKSLVAKLTKNIQKVTPKKGSKVFLDTGNPYANADVRKNYTITYKQEGADYRIISSNTVSEKYIGYFVILPTLKRIAYFPSPYNLDEKHLKKKMLEAVNLVYPESMTNDAVCLKEMYYTYDGKVNIMEAYDEANNNIAWYDSLILDAGDELTADALLILTQAAMAQSYSMENEKNCILAIQMVNNLNWRTYIGTMSRLCYLFGCRNNIFSEMHSHPSRYSKPVKEILQISRIFDAPFLGKKDYELWLEFMKKYMTVDDVKFVKMGDVNSKLSKNTVPENLFYQTFQCITRITPKSYDDYISEKQV